MRILALGMIALVLCIAIIPTQASGKVVTITLCMSANSYACDNGTCVEDPELCEPEPEEIIAPVSHLPVKTNMPSLSRYDVPEDIPDFACFAQGCYCRWSGHCGKMFREDTCVGKKLKCTFDGCICSASQSAEEFLLGKLAEASK